jgi:hypothetical protein
MSQNLDMPGALAAFRKITDGRRTAAISAWQSTAQNVLTASKNEAQGALGVCRYTISGQNFAVADITQAECATLGGDFFPTS